MKYQANGRKRPPAPKTPAQLQRLRVNHALERHRERIDPVVNKETKWGRVTGGPSVLAVALVEDAVAEVAGGLTEEEGARDWVLRVVVHPGSVDAEEHDPGADGEGPAGHCHLKVMRFVSLIDFQWC